MKDCKTSVIVGAQWGDEGKGKITHFLSDYADIFARFGGGNNAGHTVIIGNEKYKLHHIPSGIFSPEKICILGNGMVIDPGVLIDEIEGLNARGISCDNLRISDRAHIIMPYHRWIDRMQEEKRKEKKLGTTERGIGPAYVDKISRCGIRAVDLLDKSILTGKIERNFKENEDLFKGSGLSASEIAETSYSLAEKIRKYITDTSLILYEASQKGKRIMLEGAQGALLDIDFGTYPFVTSSNAISGNASTGTGIPPYLIDRVIGIAKAYTTRVGTGPFPTELTDKIGEHMLNVGVEYGTTTGRPRRCGWLDMVMLKFAKRINGINSIALTKLDVLTGINPLKIAVDYEYKGELLNNFPASLEVLADCKPVYIELPGWSENLQNCRRREDLPLNTNNYLSKIEELLDGIPIEIISVGPECSQTIVA